MNVKDIIEQTLSGFVDGNIWPFICPKNMPLEKYIVYNPEHELPALCADDKNLEWSKGFQVHLYMKKKDMKDKDFSYPVNYFGDKADITSALVENDFLVTNIEVLFEKDTGYTHICWSCEPDVDMET